MSQSHLAQEELEEGRAVADPGTTLHQQGQSADQQQCVRVTKWHCSISILQTSRNLLCCSEMYNKGDLGNVIQLRQADT